MAKVTSGSFNTSGYTGDYGKRYLVFSWSIKEQDIKANKTVINWTLKGAGGQDDYWYKAGNFKVVIDGETVYSSSTRINLYNDTKVASGTKTLYHNAKGSKSFSASVKAGIYTVAVNCTGSGTWDLKDIPRYATVKQDLSYVTEDTIVMDWSTDSEIDYLWYSVDNGNTWAGIDYGGKNGACGIYDLQPNTSYNVKIKVRRKDSQLTSETSSQVVTTYDYPHCLNTENFIIGEQLTLSLYNPLNRLVDVSFIGNNNEVLSTDKTAMEEITGYNNETFKNKLYASIPNSTSGKYKIKVTYNGNEKTSFTREYKIKSDECIPTFNTFTYKDTNTNVTKITGNDQVLVQGFSDLQVTIPSANKMVAKKSATPKNYTIGIGDITKSVNYSTNDIVTSLGKIWSTGTSRLNVRAYDSRNLSVLAYKDISVYAYSKPVINVSAERLNKFEEETTLKVDGTFTRLTINGADKNAITSVQYRYRETEGNWSAWTTIPTTIVSGKFTCNDVILSLDNTKSFEIEIKATDKLDSNTEVATLDIGQSIFFISTNKKACFINGEIVKGSVVVRSDTPVEQELIWIQDKEELFNKNTITENVYVSGEDGTLQPSQYSMATDFIPLKDGKNYKLTYDYETLSNEGMRVVAVYDSNKNFLYYMEYDPSWKSLGITGLNGYIRISLDKNSTNVSVHQKLKKVYVKNEKDKYDEFFDGDSLGIITMIRGDNTLIKFPDGTQICTLNTIVNDQAISTPYGSLYEGNREWWYLNGFKETPVVLCSFFKWGTGASWGTVSYADEQYAKLRGMDAISRAKGTDVKIHAMAIGRYK